MRALTMLSALLGLVALLGAVAGQINIAPFAPLTDGTIPVSDTLPETYEVLPYCFTRDFTVSLSNVCTADRSSVSIFFLETQLKALDNEDNDVNPTEATTFALMYEDATTGVETVVDITALADQVLGVNYAGTCGEDAERLVVPNGFNADDLCGAFYYCSRLCEINASRWFIRVTTGGAENAVDDNLGIAFKARLGRRQVPHQVLTQDVVAQSTGTIPQYADGVDADEWYLPLAQQRHFVVNIGPTGTTLAATAAYAARSAAYVTLDMQVSNLQVGETTCDQNNAQYTNIDFHVNNDLTFIDPGFGNVAMVNPALGAAIDSCTISANCRLDNEDWDGPEVEGGDHELTIPADDNNPCITGCNTRGFFHLAIGGPTAGGLGPNGQWCFDIVARFRGLEAQSIPTIIQLDNGVSHNGVIGEKTPVGDFSVPVHEDYYVISPFVSGSTLGVKGQHRYEIIVKGIGQANRFDAGLRVQVTRNFITAEAANGGDCAPVAVKECPGGVEEDFCRIVIPVCDPNIAFSTTDPYYVTITSTDPLAPDNWHRGVPYTITAYVLANDIQEVRSLPNPRTDAISTTWWFAGEAIQERYHHFHLTLSDQELTNKNTWLRYQIWTNSENEDIATFFNAGSPAGRGTVGKAVGALGNTGPNTISIGSECFSNTLACQTHGTDLNDWHTCTWSWPYCELSSDLWFSVYAQPQSSNDAEEYNENVKYTATWQLVNEAYPLSYLVTESFDLLRITNWPGPNGAVGHIQSHQFSFTVPSVSSNFFIENIRIHVTGIERTGAAGAGDVTFWMSCGEHAGVCPCFRQLPDSGCCQQSNSDAVAYGVNPTSDEITLPYCACGSGVYYISASIASIASAGTFDDTPLTWQFTPYYDQVELTDDLIELPAVRTGVMRWNPGTPENLAADTVDAALYRFRANPGENDELVVIAYIDVADDDDRLRVTVSRDGISSYNGDNCCKVARDEIDFLGDYDRYAFIRVRPCEFVPGDYFVRLEAFNPNDAATEVEFSYTLRVEIITHSALTLSPSVPVLGELRYNQYQHYQLTSPPENAWGRLELYINNFYNPLDNDGTNLGLYLNPLTWAGPNPAVVAGCPAGCPGAPDNDIGVCWGNIASCVIGENSNDDYCDIFAPACSTANGQTWFAAVRNMNDGNTKLWCDQGLPYTLTWNVQAPIVLDTVQGFPVTANVFFREETYFQFTFTDVGNKVIHFELQSIEPEPVDNDGGSRLYSMLTPSAPEGANNRCPCDTRTFVDEFRLTDYPCVSTQQAPGGTVSFFLIVRALSVGNTPVEPVSFTVRAWYDEIQSAGNINVVSTTCATLQEEYGEFTSLPEELRINYDQWVDFTVGSPGNNNVLVIEIADVPRYANVPESHLEIYVNNGGPASPAYGNNRGTVNDENEDWSMFFRPDPIGQQGPDLGVNTQTGPQPSDGCFWGSCIFNGQVDEDLPENTIMCRWQIPPCLDGDGDWHVTARMKLFDPEPSVQERGFFKIRAYSRPIESATFDPAVASPLVEGDTAMSITTTCPVDCFTWAFADTTPVANNNLDYFFSLPSGLFSNIGEQDNLELVVTGQDNDVFATSAATLFCQDDNIFACQGPNLNIFGFFVPDACRDPAAETAWTATNDLNRVITATANYDQRYTVLNSQQFVRDDDPTTYTVTAGQILNVVFNAPTFDASNLRKYSLSVNVAGGTTTVCTSCGDSTLSNDAIVRPAGQPNYCGAAACAAWGNFDVEACCNQGGKVVATIVNSAGAGVTDAVVTAQFTETVLSAGISSLSGSSSVQGGLTGVVRWLSFDVSHAQEDSLFDLRIFNVPAGVTVTARSIYGWINANGNGDLGTCYAEGDNLPCGGNTITPDGPCNAQFRLCNFNNGGRADIFDGRYYIGFTTTTDTEGQTVATVRLSVTNQPEALGTGTKNVPADIGNGLQDADYSDFPQYYSFTVPRNIRETRLGSLNGVARLTLTWAGNFPNAVSISRNMWDGTCGVNNPDGNFACNNVPGVEGGPNTSVCEIDVCLLGVGDTFYLRVTANDGEQASFTSSNVEFFYDDLVATDRWLNLTPTAKANSDGAETPGACSFGVDNSGSSGACTYTAPEVADANTPDRIFVRIPIDATAWNYLDYLLVNITVPGEGDSVSIQRDLILGSSCGALGGAVTCDNGDGPNDCAILFDPCSWTQRWRAESGDDHSPAGTAVAISAETDAVIFSITSGGGTLDTFRIYATIASPAQTVWELTTPVAPNTVSTQSATYAGWNARWGFWNVRIPNNRRGNLEISLTAECEDTPIEWFYNEDVYRFPGDDGCAEYSGDGDTIITRHSCELDGGNHIFGIYIPEDAVKYPGINGVAAGDPNLSPQVRFTITAKYWETAVDELVFGVPYSIANAATEGDPMTRYLVAYADYENPGTRLHIDIENCDTCTVTVVSPLFREQFEIGDNPEPVSPWNQPYWMDEDESCDFEDNAFSDTQEEDINLQYGYVQVVSDDENDEAHIDIPPCGFRNGRWFITVTTPINQPRAVIKSQIDRKDYKIIDINAANNFRYFDGCISLSEEHNGNAHGPWYQWYKIRPDPQSFYLHIEVGGVNGDAALFKGENGHAIAVDGDAGFNCEAGSFNCADGAPCEGDTNAGDSWTITDCELDVYYLGVYHNGGDCLDTISLLVEGRPLNNPVVDIDPNVCVSGTIVFDDDDSDQNYPERYYKLAVPEGQSLEWSDVSVTVQVGRLDNDDTLDNVRVRLAVNHVPTDNCNLDGCDVETSDANGDVRDTSAQYLCGFAPGDELYITVDIRDAGILEVIDYWFQVDVEFYTQTPIAAGEQTLAPGAANTVWVFDNTAGTNVLFSPIVGGALVSTRKTTFTDNCNANHCDSDPDACNWHGRSEVYGYRATAPAADAAPSVYNFGIIPATALTQEPADARVSSAANGVAFFYYDFTEEDYRDFDDFTLKFDTVQGQRLNVRYSCVTYPMAGCTETGTAYTIDVDDAASWENSFEIADDNVGDCERLCPRLFVSVMADEDCCFDYETSFRIWIHGETPNAVVPRDVVAITSYNQWIPDGIQRWNNVQEQWYSFTPGDFAYFALGRVNNTGGHDALAQVYANGCEIARCSTDGWDASANPARANVEQESCEIYLPNSTPPLASVYYVRVTGDGALAPLSSGTAYRYRAQNAYQVLSGCSPVAQTLEGYQTAFYRIDQAARQSVTLHVNVRDGPRLFVQWATKPEAAFDGDYTGWSQAKMCPFGECILDVSTEGQHPGATSFYVWVTPVQDGVERHEDPTHYDIWACQGTENCGGASAVLPAQNAFCTTTELDQSSYWVPRSSFARDQQAKHLYDTMRQCLCQAGVTECSAILKRFACLQFFRECDEAGFWTPVCRNECNQVENFCGSFSDCDLATEECELTRFACQSDRYQDTEVCTGVLPTPTPEPTPPPVTPTTPPTPEAPTTPIAPEEDTDEDNDDDNFPPFPTFPPFPEDDEDEDDQGIAAGLKAPLLFVLALVFAQFVARM